ncbi:MAG: ABC transporter permease [Myxococcales bacterium]|nr:ABC transporter permease [Myxococcales bacterium]
MNRSPHTPALAVIGAIVRRDVRRFLHDRNGAVLSVVMPIVLGALLGALFAPRVTRTRLLVVTGDAPTATVTSLVESLRQTTALTIETTTRDAAESAVGRGDASAALILEAGTGGAAGVTSPSAPALLVDPSKPGEASLIDGVVKGAWYENRITAVTSGPERSENEAALGAALGAAGLAGGKQAAAIVFDLAGQMLGTAGAPGTTSAGGLAPPIRRVAVAGLTGDGRPGQGYDTYAHNFAGMLCMFLLFFGIEQAKERIADRALGLDDRIHMSPGSALTVRFGQWIATALLACAISALVFGVAVLGFGVEVRGAWIGLFALVIGQAFFISAFSVALSDRCRSPRQASAIGTFFGLVASFLGGAWMPSFLLPDWVQDVAQVLPTHWATRGFAAVTWRGLGLQDAVVPALVLIGLGLVLALISGGLIRRHAGRVR